MPYHVVVRVAMAMGVILAAGVALAQTAGPSLRAPSPSIVPVTGPSTGPDLADARGDAFTAAPPPAPSAVEAVHKPGAKRAVKKASTPKRAKVATPPGKTKQVATAKRRPPTGQQVAGKPVAPGKRQAPAKSATPAPTVLPRV